MKKYNRFLLLGIIISLLIPVFGLCEEKREEKDLLIGLLDETGADFLEGDVSIGGTIIDEFINKERLEEIGDSIRTGLGIKGEKIAIEDIGEIGLQPGYYSEELIIEDSFIQLTVYGFDYDDNIITLTLSSYKDIDMGTEETSLFINLIKKAQFAEINDIIEKVESFFDEYNKPVNITTCIVGTFDGYVSLDEKEKIIVKAAKSAKGKIIEKYSEDDILSFSIYTPYIEKHIYTGNRKMNLNIAVRYNEYENKTYIWIGTPIITIGY